MSWAFIAVAVVRIIWWLVRSDMLRSRPAPVEMAEPPRETGFPQRPQLGGYGIPSPESDT